MNTKNIFAAAALLAGLCTLGTAAAQGPFPAEDLNISEIRDGIYRVGSSDAGNVTVFTSDSGVLAVDSKFERQYDAYIEMIRGVTDQPVKYLINTHMHPDHAGGNARFEADNAVIVGQENMRKRLADAQPNGLPIFTFDDHMRMYFAGKTFDLYWFGRGHTDGDLVIHIPEERIVMTGDLFAGNGVRVIDPAGGGSLHDLPGTLAKILELDFDTVIPGHMPVTNRAELEAFYEQSVRVNEFVSELVQAGRAPQEIQQALTAEFGQFGVFVFGNFGTIVDEFK